MSNEPTPETESWSGWGIGGLQVVPASFARKHYRDRDELKRWTSVNGVIDLQRERDEARDERDKMQTELEMWRDGNIMHEVHRNELEKVEQEREAFRQAKEVLAAVKGGSDE